MDRRKLRRGLKITKTIKSCYANNTPEVCPVTARILPTERHHRPPWPDDTTASSPVTAWNGGAFLYAHKTNNYIVIGDTPPKTP